MLPERFPAPRNLRWEVQHSGEAKICAETLSSVRWGLTIGPALYSLDPISSLNPRGSALSSLRSAFASVVYRPVR